MNSIEVTNFIQQSPFKDIIEEQIRHRTNLIRGIKTPRDCISLVIENNKIVDLLEGIGCDSWESRTSSYKSLFENVLNNYAVPDCAVNINLSDHPRGGYFNFCRRRKGNLSHYFNLRPRYVKRLLTSETPWLAPFLLPNYRFTQDNVKLSEEDFVNETFDDTTHYIQSKHKDFPFDRKISKIYTSSSPHRPKFGYFDYALTHDFCDGYLWIGHPIHKRCDASMSFVRRLMKQNLVGEHFVPFMKHIEYKYVLYSDGTTLSDRMRLLLNLNSVILYKQSNYEEFYTYLLKDRINYIRFNKLSELESIYQFLEKTDEGKILSKNIIENNRNFVTQILNYDNVCQYVAALLNGLFS